MPRRIGTRRAPTPPLWAKLAVGCGALLMAASAGTVGYANVMFGRINDAVESRDLLGNGGDPASDITGPLDLLMIGADLRVQDADGVARADTIMILHVDRTLKKANIVSIPRDLRVEIADCGGLYVSPCQTKINDAYPAGGPDVEGSVRNLAATVSSLTGVEFDGAAIVNFEGFLDVVKTLGKVELCLPFEMTVAHPKGKVFAEGCRDYGYEDALSIVRERYAYDPDNPEFPVEWGIGDYGRQHMQQHFVRQLLAEAAKQGYVSDPTKVGALISDIGDQLILDLGGSNPIEFAFALRDVKPANLVNIRVPSEPADIDGTSFVVTRPGEQQAAAESLYAAIRNDELDDWTDAHPEWVNKDDRHHGR